MFCFVSIGNHQAWIQPSCSDLFASSHVAVGATPTPPQLIPHLSPHIHPSVPLGHRLNLGFPPPTPCPFHTTTGTTYSQPAPASHCWHCNRQDYKERGHQNNQADRRTRTVRPSSWTEVRNYLVLFNCHLWGSWRDRCDLRSSSYKHSILSFPTVRVLVNLLLFWIKTPRPREVNSPAQDGTKTFILKHTFFHVPQP